MEASSAASPGGSLGRCARKRTEQGSRAGGCAPHPRPHPRFAQAPALSPSLAGLDARPWAHDPRRRQTHHRGANPVPVRLQAAKDSERPARGQRSGRSPRTAVRAPGGVQNAPSQPLPVRPPPREASAAVSGSPAGARGVPPRAHSRARPRSGKGPRSGPAAAGERRLGQAAGITHPHCACGSTPALSSGGPRHGTAGHTRATGGVSAQRARPSVGARPAAATVTAVSAALTCGGGGRKGNARHPETLETLGPPQQGLPLPSGRSSPPPDRLLLRRALLPHQRRQRWPYRVSPLSHPPPGSSQRRPPAPRRTMAPPLLSEALDTVF